MPFRSPWRLLRHSIVALFLLAEAPFLKAQGLFADFETSSGNFSVSLLFEDVPRTVANFVGLAEGSRTWFDPISNTLQKDQPFYDGNIFHRVVAGFVIQGGAPGGDGTLSPGYRFPDEFPRDNGGNLRFLHDSPGVLSMANSGPNSNGSQFFITVNPTPQLDGVHNVFGRISAGPPGTYSASDSMNIVNTINVVPTTSQEEGNRPLTDVVITRVTIRREGTAAETFDATTALLPTVRLVKNVKLVSTPAPEDATDQLALNLSTSTASGYRVTFSENLTSWSTVLDSNILALSNTSNTIDVTRERARSPSRGFFQTYQIDYSTAVSYPTGILLGTRLVFSTTNLDPNWILTITLDGSGGGTWMLDISGTSTSGIFQDGNYGAAPFDTTRPFANDLGFDQAQTLVFFQPPFPGGTLEAAQLIMTYGEDSLTQGTFSGSTNGSPETLSGQFQIFPPE